MIRSLSVWATGDFQIKHLFFSGILGLLKTLIKALSFGIH